MPKTDEMPPIEVMPKDISSYKTGNRGVDYVHTLDSGKPGPHVIVNALTHGNEFCGMTAVTWMFENGIRPIRGKLTLCFANVAAYHRFDPARPYESRFVDRDFNRVWDSATLNGPDMSVEVRRARELFPIYAEADAILDIHSTSYAVPPMLIHDPIPKYAELARHMHSPLHHIHLPIGKHPGRPLVQHEIFADPASAQLAVVVECGQHFAASSGAVALSAAMRFLDFFTLIPRELAAAYPPEPGEPRRFEVTEVRVARTDRFRFAQGWIGFEEVAEGTLIAMDGDEEVRAPYPRCTIIMPARRILQGRDVVSFARPV